MTIAEKLRQEMAERFDKETFIKIVANLVRRFGEAAFICDHHVRTELSNCMPTIAVRDRQAAIDAARAEGFRYRNDSNNYGVRYLVFIL